MVKVVFERHKGTKFRWYDSRVKGFMKSGFSEAESHQFANANFSLNSSRGLAYRRFRSKEVKLYTKDGMSREDAIDKAVKLKMVIVDSCSDSPSDMDNGFLDIIKWSDRYAERRTLRKPK